MPAGLTGVRGAKGAPLQIPSLANHIAHRAPLFGLLGEQSSHGVDDLVVPAISDSDRQDPVIRCGRLLGSPDHRNERRR